MSPSFSVCVYCGSRSGTRPSYTAAAQDFGAALAEKGWRLVYGAGDVGIMGSVARAAHSAGAETFGVIPTHLIHAERGNRELTHFVITETMHERKKVMFMNADAIVMLPGGAGSLDEFFEVLTWTQIGLHKKPIVLIDVDGYWQPLQKLIEHTIAEGFADASLLSKYVLVPDVAAAVAVLEEASTRPAPVTPKAVG